MAVHRKLKLMLIRHLFDPTLNMLVRCGHRTLHAHDNDLLESVQNRAARWTKSFWDPTAFQWSKSSAICVGELGWPSLKVRRNYFSILHKTTAIEFSRYFHFNTLATRSCCPPPSMHLDILFCGLTTVMELDTI